MSPVQICLQGRESILQGSHIHVNPRIYSFTGALDIDEQFHVLKTDGQPLKGLYVVGTGTDRLGVLFIEKKSM